MALSVSDGHCVDSAVALIPLLYSAIVAPNAFIPESDGDNNTFYFTGVGVLQAEIRIYNRFGTIVYHTNDFQQHWDGRDFNGNPCPMGSYVWHIRYTTVVRPNGYKEATGSVLLLR